jgi:hypothetical protein
VVGTKDTQTLTNKTLTNSAIIGGTFNAASTVSDSGTIATGSVGFRSVAKNSRTAAYTLALTDSGKHISITSGGIVISANASVAFPIGATIVIYNDSAAAQTISITTDTLRQGGTANTGSRTQNTGSLSAGLPTPSGSGDAGVRGPEAEPHHRRDARCRCRMDPVRPCVRRHQRLGRLRLRRAQRP